MNERIVITPRLAVGPQGPPAPELKIQYSSDSLSWHDDPVETDKYLSFSTDNGITWSDAIYFNNLSETLEWVEKARQWAENPEDEPVEPGEYSAYHWAKKAEAAAPPAVEDQIVDGVIYKAPSQNAVYDALAAKPDKSTLTTKGDMYIRNSTDITRLPVGSDGEILMADSNEAEGVKYTPLGEWDPVAVSPTYVDSTNFTLSGDQTGTFTKGRVLRITDTGGTFHAVCASSSYDDVTDKTTVTIAGDTIDSGLSSVELALQQNTGQIWESGSNSNGNYIKYTNGTMLCWINTTSTSIAINNAYGSLYYANYDWTFPASFIGIQTTTCSQFKWGTSASWGSVSGGNSIVATLRVYDIASRSSGTETRISAMAIGGWY